MNGLAIPLGMQHVFDFSWSAFVEPYMEEGAEEHQIAYKKGSEENNQRYFHFSASH